MILICQLIQICQVRYSFGYLNLGKNWKKNWKLMYLLPKFKGVCKIRIWGKLMYCMANWQLTLLFLGRFKFLTPFAIWNTRSTDAFLLSLDDLLQTIALSHILTVQCTLSSFLIRLLVHLLLSWDISLYLLISKYLYLTGAVTKQ